MPVRLGVWDTNASVRSVAVGPDGTIALLRATGDLQFVRFESLLPGTDPAPVDVIPGLVPPGLQATLRFSADGRAMTVTREDGKVAVWDMEKKVAIGASFANTPATGAYPSPDGKSVLVASDQATVLWNLDVTLWAEKVCFAAGRNLTEAEWTKYFPGRDYEVTCPQWPAKPKT